MKIQGKNKKEIYQSLIRLLVCMAVYLGFALVFGVFTNSDSEGYINMSTTREPVYPLFLLLVRKMTPGDDWMQTVILIQNLLMACGVWLLSEEVGREFRFPQWGRYLLLLPHFGVAALCQFAAGRASLFTNSILTEGLTMAFWLYFIYFLFRAYCQDSWAFTGAAFLLAAVMMDTRKQMAVAFIIAAIFLAAAYAGTKEYVRRMLLLLLLTVFGVGLALGGTRYYNYMLRGDFAPNTRDMNLVLTTSLYVADREDAQLIEEENVRRLFSQVYDILDQKECNYKYAGKGWRNLEAHYGAHYDMITIDTTKDLFTDYAESMGCAPGMEAEQEADRMSGIIVRSLLRDNLGTYARVYFASVLNGFVNTVAKKGMVLDLYALCVYLLYVGLMVFSFVRLKNKRAAFFALMVLTAIVVNVLVTAAVIFCQTRYMVYNMALFYVALLVMAHGLMRNERNMKGKQQ